MALGLLDYVNTSLLNTPSDITKKIEMAKLKASNIQFNSRNKVQINMTPEQGSVQTLNRGADGATKY